MAWASRRSSPVNVDLARFETQMQPTLAHLPEEIILLILLDVDLGPSLPEQLERQRSLTGRADEIRESWTGL